MFDNINRLSYKAEMCDNNTIAPDRQVTEPTVQELDTKYIAGTYARFPINIVRGKGALLYDDKGKEYIDMGSGIAVNTFGVCDDEWISAVTKQLNLCQHTSNLFISEPSVRLAEKLCQISGMSKVFFSNSGAEANECAIKAARKYAADKYTKSMSGNADSGDKCCTGGSGNGLASKSECPYTIITLNHSFHGRTITTLAATGQESFHRDFLPLTEGFKYAEPGDIGFIEERAKTGRIAAVMFEVVQGEGGVIPLSGDFLRGLDALAKKYDFLLIADEVQTGNGRTGEYFAYMHYGIKPDIVTTAKGLGGGLPIGATLLSDKVSNVFTPGTHGSTFGGNPVACAGALSIVSRIDKILLDNVRRLSDYIIRELSGAKGILEVSGMGLMLGIKTTRPVSDVISECHERGVLVIKAKDKVRLLPPLNIPDELLSRALDVIKEVCARI